MSDSKDTGGKSEEVKGEAAREDGAQSSESGNDAAEGVQKSSLGMDMNSLSDYLAQQLGIRERPPSKLEEISLKGIANYLNSDQCKNVITMAGAGISTSAGIPDFRTPGTGLYDNLAAYELPHPTAIFEIDFFKEQPKPFFVLAKELFPGSFKPTVCHYFLKMLSDKGKLLRHYTQNIDTLERVAGINPDHLVEAHGTFQTSHCLKCGKEFSLPWMKEEIFADRIPACDVEDCDGVVKPDIVFFGESLPERFAKHVNDDFSQCSLLIIMGTSLQVQPFASLINRVPLDTPRLYINLESGMTCSNPIAALIFGGGFEFDKEDNYRDVFKQATCDEGCEELADLLGWGDDLRKLVKSEHEKIDKANKTAAKSQAAATSRGQASSSSSQAKEKKPDPSAIKKKL